MAEYKKSITCWRCGASVGHAGVKPTRRRGMDVVVDNNDYITHECPETGLTACHIWKWQRSTKWEYAVLRVNRRKVMVNRIQLGIVDLPYITHQTLHACDNPPCVNPEHLSVGTSADNTADKMAKGRHTTNAHALKGTANGRARLNDEDVIDIRSRIAAGESHRSIAAVYGITSAMVSHIRTGKKWGWLR